MKKSLQPVLLTLTLLAGFSFAGCTSTATTEKKADATTVTMTPLPAAPTTSTPPTPPPAIAVTSAPTPLPTAANFYRIRAGDTGMKIARAHRLNISDLLALNPDVQWNRLKVGQMVRIHAE